MAKKGSRAWWTQEVDRLWSEIVKIKAGYRCEETNATDNLQSAHIIRRNYRNVRWDLENGICLVNKRHVWYTHHPLEWENFIKAYKGKAYYEKLRAKALIRKQWRLSEIKKKYEEFETYRKDLLRRRNR